MKIDKVNTGMLFKNDRKVKDTDPDYKGNINHEGEQLFVSAWINTTKDCKKYLRLRFAAKNGEFRGHGALHPNDPDDDIAF